MRTLNVGGVMYVEQPDNGEPCEGCAFAAIGGCSVLLSEHGIHDGCDGVIFKEFEHE